MRRFLLALATAVPLATTACGTAGSAVAPLEIPDGDSAGAESSARDAVRAQPDDARALAALAAVLSRRGAHDEAVKLASRAAGLEPRNPEIARWQGRILLAADRPLEALRAFNRALAVDPDWAGAYAAAEERSVIDGLAAQVGRNRSVVREAANTRFSDEALGAAKGTPALFDAIGLWRAGAGSHSAALEAFERARGARPDLPADIARSLLALRQVERAVAELDAWVQAAPEAERQTRLVQAGDLLEERLSFDAAERTYARALEATPNDRGLALKRAGVLLKARRTEEAEKALKALVASADTSDELVSIGQLCLRFGAGDLAGDAFARAVTRSPDDAGLWKVAVRALGDAGRAGEIEQIIGMPERHAAWGDAWLELRQPEKALARYELAKKQPGAPVDLTLRMARAAHQLDKPERRDALVAEYMTASARSLPALTQVARFYEAIGASKQALATYRGALSKAPRDRTLVFALAKTARDTNDAVLERQTLDAWAAAAPAGAERAAAWLAVGEYWAALKRGPDASQAFERAMSEGDTPSRRPALLAAAEVAALVLREPGRAESLYRAWVDAAPAAERAAARKRVADTTRADPSMARLQSRLLEDVVRDQPDDADAYANLGDAYLRLRPPQRDAAERAFRRFIDLSPDRRAAVLRAGGRLEDANAISEAARAYAGLEPSDVPEAERLLSIARVLLRTGDAVRARAFADAYITLVPEPTRAVRDELFRMAGQLVASGGAETAVRLYRALLPGEQNQARVLKPLAEAQLTKGDEEGAVASFEAYINASGKSFQAIAAVGDAFRQRRAYGRARGYYEAVFDERARTRLPRLFPVLFETYAKLGDKDALRDLAQRYVKLTPNPRAYADAARRLREAGLLRDALALYAEAARTQPNATPYREQEAAIALSLGEVDTAVAALDAMLAKDRSSLGWVKAAQLLTSRGQEGAARALLDRGLAAGVKGGTLYAERARIRLRAGDLDGARADFVEAVADEKELEQVVPILRQSLFGGGQLEAATDVLRRILAAYPERHETWLELGDAAALMGRLGEAETLWSRYAEKDSRGAFIVAGRLWSNGATSSARRYYERALALDTTENRLGVLAELVSALLVLGLPERVPPTLERFVALGESDLEAGRVGPLLEQTGFVDEAIDAYESLILARPAPEAWYRLGMLRALRGKRDEAASAFQRYLDAEASQSERVVSSDRGKLVALRLQRTAKVLAVWEQTLAFDQALALLRAERARAPELGALALHAARLELASGHVEAGLVALDQATRANVTLGVEPELLWPVLEQARTLGRGPEVLAILIAAPPELYGVPAAAVAARLADTGALRAALEPLLEGANGERRVALGRLLAEAGLEGEAQELWQQALEPGRGLGGIEGALRELLKRANGEDAVEDVEARLGRVVEERGEQSRLMALASFAVGHYEDAADHAEAWAQSLPSTPDLKTLSDASTPNPWLVLLDSDLRLNRGEQAMAVVDRLAREADGPKAIYTFAADFFADRVRPDLARQAVGRALAVDKGDTELEVARVSYELASGAREEALAHVAALTTTPARLAHLGASLVEALARAGELDEALALMARAPDMGSIPAVETALARQGRGAELSELLTRPSPDPHQQAVRLCAVALTNANVPVATLERLAQEAMARRPEALHPMTWLTRAVVALGHDDVPGALTLLDRVVAMGGPELAAILDSRRHASGPYNSKASAYGVFVRQAIVRGRADAALAALKRWLTGSGTLDDRLEALTALTRELQAPNALTAAGRDQLVAFGLQALEPARLTGEGLTTVHSIESELMDAGGDANGAIAVYREALRRFPSSPGLKNNLAYLLARHERDLEEALTLVQQSLEDAPDNAAALDTEGWVLHRLGRDDEAASRLHLAIRYTTQGERSGHAEMYYHLGVVEQRRGNTDDAAAAFAKAAQLDPSGTYGILAAKELPKR